MIFDSYFGTESNNRGTPRRQTFPIHFIPKHMPMCILGMPNQYFSFFFLANPDIVLNPHNHGEKNVFASDTRSLETFRLPNHQPWLYHYIERFSKKLWKRLFKDWYFAVFFLPQPRLFYTDLFMHVLPYNIVCMFRFFQVLESEGLV